MNDHSSSRSDTIAGYVTAHDTAAGTFDLVTAHDRRYRVHVDDLTVAEFLRTGVREGDRVSLVATGVGAWWTTRMEAGRDELITMLQAFAPRSRSGT